MARDVIIFDTTLRDGEQAPGNAMSPEAKLRLARQLDTLGVDVIEAGFPAASQGDLRGVQQVAETVPHPIVAAGARGLASCRIPSVTRRPRSRPRCSARCASACPRQGRWCCAPTARTTSA